MMHFCGTVLLGHCDAITVFEASFVRRLGYGCSKKETVKLWVDGIRFSLWS